MALGWNCVISDSGNHSPSYARRRRWPPVIYFRLCLLCFMAFPFLSRESLAETRPSSEGTSQSQGLLKLNQKDKSSLAERLAPVLVFHADEKYFPCSPLFPAELKNLSPGLPSSGRESPVSYLKTAESRKAAYLGLTMEQKADLAIVFYRVYPARRRSENVVVIEYWLYYVQNAYRIRGSFLPLWFNANHPNDLEHIHFILKILPDESVDGEHSDSGVRFAVEAVYASAHEGVIPANRYLHFERPEADSTRFLVELGSHASATDIDRDGRFTPGRDGDSGYKILWGIRDKGIPWFFYRRSYMVPRSGDNSITFSREGSEAVQESSSDGNSQNRHFSYRLVPVEKLAGDFAELELTPKQRKETFETRVNWVMRALGRSNGNSDKLLLPPDPETRSDSPGIQNFAHTERAFTVGFTNLIAEPGAFLGGRYAFLNGKRYLPDLILEADGIVTTKGKGYLSTQFLLAYPVDATVKLMGGMAFVTDTLRFDRRQWDWIGAIEGRLGSIRIYGATRSWGPITRSAVDFRVAYFF